MLQASFSFSLKVYHLCAFWVQHIQLSQIKSKHVSCNQQQMASPLKTDNEHTSFTEELQGSARPNQFSTVNNTILNQFIPHYTRQLKNTKYKYGINANISP